MKLIQTAMPPGILFLLIPIAILFVAVMLPIILFVGIFSCIVWVLTGHSPQSLILRTGNRRRSGLRGNPSGRRRPEGASRRAAEDDTIECEVISARTIDENGQEIR